MNIGLLFIALTSLSSSPLWVRMAASGIAVICFWRLLGAALAVSLPSLLRRAPMGLQSKTEARLSLAAGVFFFAHIWTYVYAAQHTTVAHTVLIFSSAPIFTAIGASIAFQEKFPKHLYFVYLLAALGIYLLFTDPTRASTARSFASSTAGDVSALVSAVLHAGYALTSRQARKTAPNMRFSFWLYAISGVLFLGLAIAQGDPLVPPQPAFYGAIAGLILFPSLLGHTLFTYLLNFININILSCAKLLEPAIATALAFLFFDEEIGVKTAIAFLLMMVAVLLLFRPWKARDLPNPVS
jgi:drug/metabolite transporter (DMT)-like permease